MAFVNEVISDADIDRYQLPFPKGSGRYWTRDAERDYYLWGGLSGNPAFGDEIRGRFWLYLAGGIWNISIEPGEWSRKFTESPYRVSWISVSGMEPRPKSDLERRQVVNVLREALVVYGRDGQENRYTPVVDVKFGF